MSMETADPIRPSSSRKNETDAGIASSRFFEKAHESLVRHLKGKLASIEEAEDLAQEACIRFLRAQRSDREIQHPKAYLYQIARHLLYHHYQVDSQQMVFAEIDSEELVCKGADLEVLTAEAIRRQQVNRAVGELAPKCQRVLLLRWREGLRVLEIAEEMGLSQGMVKKYLAQGLAHCRKRLSRYIVADQAA